MVISFSATFMGVVFICRIAFRCVTDTRVVVQYGLMSLGTSWLEMSMERVYSPSSGPLEKSCRLCNPHFCFVLLQIPPPCPSPLISRFRPELVLFTGLLVIFCYSYRANHILQRLENAGNNQIQGP